MFNVLLKMVVVGVVVMSDSRLCATLRKTVKGTETTHPSGKKALMILSPRGLMANSGIRWKSSRLHKPDRRCEDS